MCLRILAAHPVLTPELEQRILDTALKNQTR
jgi:hypothetical protein